MLKAKCCSITLVGADIITRFLATKNVTVGTTAVNSCPSNAGRKALLRRAFISGNGRWWLGKGVAKKMVTPFAGGEARLLLFPLVSAAFSLMIPDPVASNDWPSTKIRYNSERVAKMICLTFPRTQAWATVSSSYMCADEMAWQVELCNFPNIYWRLRVPRQRRCLI